MKVYELLKLIKEEEPKLLETYTLSYNSHNAIYVNVSLNKERLKIDLRNIKTLEEFKALIPK